MFVENNLIRFCLARQCYPVTIFNRFAHYKVNQKGEKVVVSKRHNIKTNREKWQDVKTMGEEPELRKINRIEKDERLYCDPVQAKNTAENKLQQLRDRLLISGFCREIKPYNPPQDADKKIDEICKEVFNIQDSNTSLDEILLDDDCKKFKFLIRCKQEFNYDIPNSDLFLMVKVKDVRHFYLTPIQGINSYERMIQNSDSLPKNLHVIPEPIIFNPKYDTFFGGVTAYPGSVSEQTGLRAKKKYPTSKNNFIWPDV